MSAGDAGVLHLVSHGGARAEISPSLGFNCIRLALVPQPGRPPVDVVHSEPDVLAGGSPTRSGIPVLFPFPNRIAGASFATDGRTWALPRAHRDGPNAIHGYACRAAWTRYEMSGSAAVTGRFAVGRDTRDDEVWPGALELALTYELADDALSITAAVSNGGTVPAPFGLGLHAYLRPLAGTLAGTRLWCDATSRWVLDDGIPTGAVVPVDGRTDLRQAPPIADRVLDDVLTGLPAGESGADGLVERARVLGGGLRLAMACGTAFREMVVFTPDNRHSIAVEPYTCPTDAAHLQRPDRDVGWRSLEPGRTWQATVRLTLGPDDVGPDR